MIPSQASAGLYSGVNKGAWASQGPLLKPAICWQHNISDLRKQLTWLIMKSTGNLPPVISIFVIRMFLGFSVIKTARVSLTHTKYRNSTSIMSVSRVDASHAASHWFQAPPHPRILDTTHHPHLRMPQRRLPLTRIEAKWAQSARIESDILQYL